jgi:hypothetical protein
MVFSGVIKPCNRPLVDSSGNKTKRAEIRRSIHLRDDVFKKFCREGLKRDFALPCREEAEVSIKRVAWGDPEQLRLCGLKHMAAGS